MSTKSQQNKLYKLLSNMSGSRRCILQHYNKCRTTSTPGTFGLGVCCVLSMYEAADLVGDGAFTAIQKYCRVPTDAPSYGTDGAWHKRAQFLLAQVSKAHHQDSIQPEVWNRVTEVLGEAETILQTRCLSNNEVNTINQITMWAVKFAPLYPCLSQCAKLWYEIRTSAEGAQGPPHNANTTSFGQCSLVVATPSRPQMPQGNNSSHDSESYKHLQVPSHAETLTLFHQRRRQSPSGLRTAESLPSEEELEDLQADQYPFLAEEIAGTDWVTDGEVGQNEIALKNLTLVEEHVVELVVYLKHAHRRGGATRVSTKLVNVKERLRTLCKSLSQLSNKSPTMDAQILATLTNMRSSLITARAKVISSPWVRMCNRHMTMFNIAIFRLSHLWHQARLANMKINGALQPQELESLRGVIDSPKENSSIRYVAFNTYAALLTATSDEEAREVVHNFLTFSDLANGSIDLTTAKLYLLILLYLEYEDVKLFEVGVQKLLSKLISKLRCEIFEAKKTEISICHIPEFKEFFFAFFKVRPCQGFDWRDSLRSSDPLVRDRQRPIIAKLLQYGSSFRNGVDELKRLTTSASLASNKREVYARQVESLEAFRRHLLSIDSPTSVFADGQTLAYLKQFVAFAKTRLNECEVDGHATCRKQVRVLEVTLECLQWCRLLSSYLEAPSPSLEETYDMVAHALILDSLWSYEVTAPLLDSERAFISQGILSALRSNNVDDDLLLCAKMFLDRSVPTRFVEILLSDLLLFRAQKTSDYDRMVTLLASECRMALLRVKLASSSHIPSSAKKFFVEALVQARLAAKGVNSPPAPSQSLSPSLQARFVASPAHEAPQLLSVDVVLEGALKETNLGDLTVSETARHVATYLMGNSVDEEWLEFLTCQVNWCSLTPQQLAELQGELMTLVQNLGTLLKAFWFSARWVKSPDSSVEATPDLVRHFVNAATLKWLLKNLMGNSKCPAEVWQSLCKVAGDYAFAWMPKWIAFMHNSQALFPSDVIVDADFVERLCVDVSRQMYFTVPPKAWVGPPLDNQEVSARLRHLMKGVFFGTLTRQDFEALLETHLSRVVTRWNTNVFLTFLLYACHNTSLPVDRAVIEECIKTIVNEGALLKRDVGMTVGTLRNCIMKLVTLQLSTNQIRFDQA
eukprot:Blabericola_migrator_1__8242@NODE_426_length_8602_cov_18_656825_g336_i0_p2_GENE_NODE_426_length_8602_cov_18_656825_g336_i0NODE_426_length_8602_cov_18_656825_g336_i0_p2_ORF_typecomplete_len1144_score193_93DUF2408/PF10303_9/51DUF2408/PF10303_9/11Sp38/PF07354_12/5_1e03Sp38/PF07354_12/0_38Sp38/PF07354_12/4e03Sp38/PF07354_12/6_9e02_NODE_426_length_8602_cov_18_656825_g336_i01423573